LDDGYCGAAAVEFDPDMGCMTFSRADDIEVDDDWDGEDPDIEEWEDLDVDDDEELWLEDDDDF
jgi:hypothetical protein